jgi:hypothetical protein
MPVHSPQNIDPANKGNKKEIRKACLKAANAAK